MLHDAKPNLAFPKGGICLIALLLGMADGAVHADDMPNRPKTKPAQAIPSDDMPDFSGLKRLESFELAYVPAENSPGQELHPPLPNLLPKLTGSRWSNGIYSIVGQGTYPYAAPCVAYEYQADLIARTYTIIPLAAAYALDDSHLKLQAMETEINSKELTSAYNAGIFFDIPDETTPACRQSAKAFASTDVNKQPAINPGVYDVTVALRTRDPADWTITKTSDRLGWRVATNGTVRWLYWHAGWYAVNPSPIGTHWYIHYKADWGPYYSVGSASVSKGVYGTYYNYDWRADELSTNVSQRVTVQGNSDATYDYSWRHYDWGENHRLIWGVVTLE